MASRTKKKAVEVSDTVTFKKSELVEKLKEFLENENACDGDWLNKVRVEFLGEKVQTVHVRVYVAADLELEMAGKGKPTAEEIKNHVTHLIEIGELCLTDTTIEDQFTVDADTIEVMDV